MKELNLQSISQDDHNAGIHYVVHTCRHQSVAVLGCVNGVHTIHCTSTIIPVLFIILITYTTVQTQQLSYRHNSFLVLDLSGKKIINHIHIEILTKSLKNSDINQTKSETSVSTSQRGGTYMQCHLQICHSETKPCSLPYHHCLQSNISTM